MDGFGSKMLADPTLSYRMCTRSILRRCGQVRPYLAGCRDAQLLFYEVWPTYKLVSGYGPLRLQIAGNAESFLTTTSQLFHKISPNLRLMSQLSDNSLMYLTTYPFSSPNPTQARTGNKPYERYLSAKGRTASTRTFFHS